MTVVGLISVALAGVAMGSDGELAGSFTDLNDVIVKGMFGLQAAQMEWSSAVSGYEEEEDPVCLQQTMSAEGRGAALHVIFKSEKGNILSSSSLASIDKAQQVTRGLVLVEGSEWVMGSGGGGEDGGRGSVSTRSSQY